MAPVSFHIIHYECGYAIAHICSANPKSPIGLERTTESSRVYEGKIINLRVDQITFERGQAIREVVEHRGAVAVLPLFENDNVILVRQYRYAVSEELLEVPAGTLEKGEEPDACASRELEEETGYTSSNVRKIFECYVAPGYSTERIHFYLAKKLSRSRQRTEDDEKISVEILPLHKAMGMVRAGKIRDAKTICALYRTADMTQATSW